MSAATTSAAGRLTDAELKAQEKAEKMGYTQVLWLSLIHI